MSVVGCFFFFQAEDGIRDAQESRGLGDVYKRQVQDRLHRPLQQRRSVRFLPVFDIFRPQHAALFAGCLLYTSDAADDLLCVDLGGPRIIQKKNKKE